MPSKFIKKYSIIYTICGLRGRGCGQGRQRAKSDNVGKEDTGYLRHSLFRTDNHSPRGRAMSPETTTLTPTRHLPQHHTDLAKSVPGQGHRTKVPFVLFMGASEHLRLVCLLKVLFFSVREIKVWWGQH